MTAQTARQLAFSVLLKIHTKNAYSNLALDAALSAGSFDERERALAASLVYSCLERLLTLDYNLALYLRQPIKKLRPEVLTALRLGACQLLFFDKIPPSAAVNSSVSLVKEMRCAFAAGLVNAVLRQVADNGLQLPKQAHTDIAYRSIKYSCPEWIVRLWEEAYGAEHCEGLLRCSQGGAPLTLRVNTTKTTAAALLDRLREEGLDAEASPLAKNALTLRKSGAIEQLSAFREGLFHVQDAAAQLCCKALQAEPGHTVFDLCAAPGGKSFTLAQTVAPGGTVRAFDLSATRLALVQRGAERLGLSNISIAAADAAAYDPASGQADRVLCDVPCSGLGILRRKPEIRYKTPEDIDKLPNLQYLILCNAARYVKQKGLFVYSTCSLNPAENERVCERFLAAHPGFRFCPVLPEIPRFDGASDSLTLMPHLHNCDGFFIAAFRRMETA